jgi:hypothetical protein
MKVRKGFVSNSSSSSFVCKVCGEAFEGRDAGYEDFELFGCINGHTMCQEHALKELTINGKTQEEIEEEDDEDGSSDYFEISEIDEACCPICNWQTLSYSDAESYLLKTSGITTEEVFTEIKKVNSRRKKVYAEEYVKYVFERKGLTDEKFIESMKSQFKTYEEYTRYKPTEGVKL